MTARATLEDATQRANAYLAVADRFVPEWITDFYIVGSAALDEYRPGRSDVDFVAIVASGADRSRLLRLRGIHALAGLQAARRSWSSGGTPNGVFVADEDIALPVTRIRPVAAHTGLHFEVGSGFDVNPVMWNVLANRAIRIRGRDPSDLGLDPEPAALKAWNLANLDSYWRPLGRTMSDTRTFSALRYGHGWATAWATLGPPRLHHTIATGDVIGKRTAGEYALDTFDPEWHSVIQLGLNWWHDRGAPVGGRDDARRAGEFVLHVADDARRR